MVAKSIPTKITEFVKQKPFIIVLISILFGMVGAFVDAVIDHLFYYDENLLEVLIPNFYSHEFYMRVMLILTLASFALMVAFLIKSINKYQTELKSINENLEQIVDQRTKEFSDLFLQSPYAKALLTKNYEILETNTAWDKFFRNENSTKTGKIFLKSKLFENAKIETSFNYENIEQNKVVSESIYSEELDKALTISIYPITDNQKAIVKLVCNIIDITDSLLRHESDKELEVQKITKKTIFNFLDAERSRLANELHDDIGQKLMISKLHLELLKKEKEITPEKLDETINLIQQTNQDIKNIVYALYPAEIKNYGLINAIRSRLNNCGKLGKFEVVFNVYGKQAKLNKEVELGIYRICQEAFSNITKHSKATKVTFGITFGESMIVCLIEDNGEGFKFDETNIKEKSFGLISMQERANILGGNLEIESSLSKGTKIFLEIPMEEN